MEKGMTQAMILRNAERPSMETDEKGATQIFGSVAKTDSVFIPCVGATRPMYLIVVAGGIPGEMIRLSQSGTRIGRSGENSWQLLDASISRRHASIGADGKGDVWITDLASTNGTFLNGKRLAGHVAYRLKDGDRLQFGASVVVKFVRLDPVDEQFQRDLFERTVRDPLTTLYNRAFFVEQLGALAERAAGLGLGLAVLMLDVDHFKRVNDSFGHDVGDQVLCEVAHVLRDSTRTEDLVARYGGEEFVAALPVSAPDQATERAERIRANLAARRIETPGSPLRVTASIGLAFAHPGRVRNPVSLISAADNCLYQAKNAGRNRVVFRVDPGAASSNGTGTDSDLVTPRSDDF
jgi:two-component system cell cycle response regulator